MGAFDVFAHIVYFDEGDEIQGEMFGDFFAFIGACGLTAGTHEAAPADNLCFRFRPKNNHEAPLGMRFTIQVL